MELLTPANDVICGQIHKVKHIGDGNVSESVVHRKDATFSRLGPPSVMTIRSGIRKSLSAPVTILCASVWLLVRWLGVQGVRSRRHNKRNGMMWGKINAES